MSVYFDGHKSSGLKVGDKVIIKNIRNFKPNSPICQGWKSDWCIEMNKYIGEIGTIISDLNVSGFVIEFNNNNNTNVSEFHIKSDNYIRWAFPYFVLEKVEDKKEKDILDIWDSLICVDLKKLEREKSVYIKKKPKNKIIQYIRDNKRNKIGVMIAFRRNKEIYIGWSLCSKQDIFNKEFGIKLAIIRAKKLFNYEYINVRIPYSIFDDIKIFIDRCTRYFKGGIYPDWVLIY